MYGATEDLTRFREFVAGDDPGDATAFDFNKLIPSNSGVTLISPSASSDPGQMLRQAHFPDELDHAFIVTPNNQ